MRRKYKELQKTDWKVVINKEKRTTKVVFSHTKAQKSLNLLNGIHCVKTLAPVHRSSNISKCSYSPRYFLFCLLEWLIQSWCYGKRSYLTESVLPRKFSNDSERREKVSIILSWVSYRMVYIIYLKIALCRRFVVLPLERCNSLSKNWNVMGLSQRCSCLH